DTFEQGLNSLYYFAPKSLRGPSDFNVAHTVAVNGLWAVPTPQSFTGFAKTAAGGWQLGGIVKYNSGVPTTPIIGGDPMGLGNGGADQFGIPNYIPGCNPVNSSVTVFINASCYALPTVSASSPLAASCADFPFDHANGQPRIAPPSGQV